MRWHANTLAVTDDSTDVLPSADLPVYSDGEVPEDLYHPPHTGELVTIEVYDADHSGPIEIDPKDDTSR